MQHGRESRTEDTENWANHTFSHEPKYLARARELSIANDIPQIALSPLEGKLLSLLLKWNGCKKIVEVGTLFGYSGSWIASILPADGLLYTFEFNEKNAATATQVFESHPNASQINLIQGDALQNLAKIESEGPFDAIFIDAQKYDYPTYLDWAEKNVKKGGLIIGDNTYYFGKIHWDLSGIDPSEKPGLSGMQAFNQRLADPEKYESILLPTGEGMTVAKKLF